MRALFGTQLYPTPASLATRMLAKVNLTGATSVLEPSAGAGDLIDAIMQHFGASYRYDKLDLDAVEIDPDLAAMLRGKGHRVVWGDFLTFCTWKRYDLIVMNPPFADGAKHLLKALELQAPHGGTTVCLLNAETLRNPYTAERRELVARLAGADTEVEYVDRAFATADRATDVEVAIVKVVTAEPDRSSFIRGEFRAAQEQQQPRPDMPRHDQMVTGDAISDMIADFDMEAALGAKLIELWEQTAPLILSGSEDYARPLLELKINDRDATVNGFLTGARRKAWKRLFQHPSLVGKLTIGMKNELHQRIDEFAGYDFNLYNIKALQESLVQGLNRGVQDEAIKVFDTLSQRHAMTRFSKNVHYYNGWKTNDAWKVNRRVIVPTYTGYFAGYFGSGTKGTLSDIEQVLNYFDGMSPIERPVESVLAEKWSNEVGRKIAFHYFDATVYAKGTIHITFRCPELVKRLNVFAGRHYNMLPPDYGNHPYQDLTEDDQQLVDEFEGEQSYADTRQYLSLTGGPTLALERKSA